jgi:two-component system response regulator MprA
MTTVGVCEDDEEFRGVLRTTLESEGFVVVATATGSDAVRRFAADPPDLLILDIGLPDADGRDVCGALRERGVEAPVLFLTARDAVPDRLSGYRVGADDYVIKPVALAELLVRVEALLRRLGPKPQPDEIVLDPRAHAVVQGTSRVPLTPTEYRLMARLAASRGTVVPRQALIAAGWPDGSRVEDNTLDAYLVRIRTKLEAVGAPARVATVRGVGHILE